MPPRKTTTATPAEDVGAGEYPKAKYRKVKTSVKHPNGYEARAVADAELEARLDPTVWKDSPDEVRPPVKKKPVETDDDAFV